MILFCFSFLRVGFVPPQGDVLHDKFLHYCEVFYSEDRPACVHPLYIATVLFDTGTQLLEYDPGMGWRVSGS